MDGSGAAERLTTSPNSQLPQSFSPDGKSLVLQEEVPDNGTDLRLLLLDNRPRVEPFAQTRFNEGGGEISPDGRWLVYRSNESGRSEIYARPFPSGVGKWQVSTPGGTPARWSRNGQGIFYVNRGKVMAVSVTKGPSFRGALPAQLLRGAVQTTSTSPPTGSGS